MLSAVESHFGGPGRPYTHYAGQPLPNILQPCPISSLPTLNTAAAVASMSAAKFARPHPKTRYTSNRSGSSSTSSSLRNGLASSPRSKYLEQTDPVNLAVSQQQHQQSTSTSQTQQSQHQKLDDVAANIYATHKLPYVTNQAAAAAAAVADAYNFSNLYNRPDTIYGTQPLYQPHSLVNRNQLHHRSPYLNSQLDPYSTYLPPVTILPPPPPPPPPPPSLSLSGISSTAHQHQSHQAHQSLQQQQQLSHSGAVASSVAAKTSLLVNERSLPQAPIQQHQQPHHQNVMYEKLDNIERHSSNKSKSTGSSGSNNMIVSNGKTVGFKVPSGKEGSLKHRILTRPYSDREKSKSLIHGSIIKSSINNNTYTNFSKGSLVELANGELRTVEEMQVDDFIMSSSKNPDLQLADTTVVNIVQGQHNSVIITFSYNDNKFDMEALPEHPFFVYGNGWSSCHPDGSLQVFGLKCNRLQIGDICISLTRREAPLPQQQQPQIQKQQQPQYYNPYTYNNNKDEISSTPQNLSRKPSSLQTIPTTATSTAVTSRPVSHYDVTQSLNSYTSFLNSPPNVSTNHSIHQGIVMRSDESSCHPSSSSSYSSRPLSQDGLTRTIPLHIIGTSSSSPPISLSPSSSSASNNRISATNYSSQLSLLPPPPPPPPLPLNTIYSGGGGSIVSGTSCNTNNNININNNNNNDDMSIMDATLSNRKRRWSAPDNALCDDDNCQQKASGQKKCNH